MSIRLTSLLPSRDALVNVGNIFDVTGAHAAMIPAGYTTDVTLTAVAASEDVLIDLSATSPRGKLSIKAIMITNAEAAANTYTFVDKKSSVTAGGVAGTDRVIALYEVPAHQSMSHDPPGTEFEVESGHLNFIFANYTNGSFVRVLFEMQG